MNIRKLALAFGALIAGGLALPATGAAEEDSSLLYLGVGAGQLERSKYREVEFDIAYRPNYSLWIFKPHFGALFMGDGNYYGYGGVLADFYLGQRVVLTLSTAAGLYGGGGYDLGSHVQFRSGIDLAYRFDNRSRLGVGFFHMSNGGLTDRNPGSESLIVTYSHPVSF